ncbi:MAG TPA: hypothetical protein VGN37_07110 [Actinocatenispora sp.]
MSADRRRRSPAPSGDRTSSSSSGTDRKRRSDPPADPSTPRPGVLRRYWSSTAAMLVTTGALAVLLVAGLVLGAAFGWDAYRKRQEDTARKAAMSAAKTTVSNFMSVSAGTVDRDLKRTLAGATGDFKREYQNGMDQTKSAVVENKVDAKARVLWAGIVTSKDKSATVLVAMDATVRNTNAPDGRRAHYRVQVTMAEQNGHWLVSKLDFV